MGRRRAERLAEIRNGDDLEDALAVAPDPTVLPQGLTDAEEPLWKDYCRYYRRRLDAISAEMAVGGSPRHSPPRSFASYQQVVSRRGKTRTADTPESDLPRTLPKAVIPPREGERHPAGAGAAAAAAPAHPAPAAPESGPANLPILGMSSREIMAQIERDIDDAAERAPGTVVKLKYDGALVPVALRPAMLEYAQHYGRQRWSQLVYIAY